MWKRNTFGFKISKLHFRSVQFKKREREGVVKLVDRQCRHPSFLGAALPEVYWWDQGPEAAVTAQSTCLRVSQGHWDGAVNVRMEEPQSRLRQAEGAKFEFNNSRLSASLPGHLLKYLNPVFPVAQTCLQATQLRYNKNQVISW